MCLWTWQTRGSPDALASGIVGGFGGETGQQVLDVRKFGAQGDDETNDVEAFRAALRTAAATPFQGQHVIATGDDGRYLLRGTLRLPSFTRLEIGRNTTLRFDIDGKEEQTLTNFEGTTVVGRPPLIGGFLGMNVSIVGLDRSTSRIDGGGWTSRWNEHQAEVRATVRDLGNKTGDVCQRFESELPPPNFIEFFGSTRIFVSDLTLVNSPFWTVHFYGCDHVWARRLTLRSSTPNADGFDIQSSSNVVIEEVDVDTTDDAIAIKSGRDADGWRIARPATNIVVRRSVLLSRFNAGLAVGSEVSGGVKSIYFVDNVVPAARFAFVVKSNLDRGGYVQDILVRHLSAANISQACVALTHSYHESRGQSDFATLVSDVDVEDLTCSPINPSEEEEEEQAAAAESVRLIDAVGRDAARPLRDLRFRDVYFLSPRQRRFEEYARVKDVADLRLANVHIEEQDGPTLMLRLRTDKDLVFEELRTDHGLRRRRNSNAHQYVRDIVSRIVATT